MIRIRETLLPEHILLGMTTRSRDETIRQLSESLRSDTRISDWQEFSRALAKWEVTGKVNLQYGLALPHIRSTAVTKILMAFGRLTDPLQDSEGRIQFVMLVGIPLARDSEYLRLVGTLMRVFRNEKLRQKLLLAQNPSEIVQIFEKGETSLGNDE